MLPDQELRRRLAEQRWTAHNIRLTPATTTMPGEPDFLEEDSRLKAILRVLALAYQARLGGLRIADLGCLEGGFALALAQRGARVLGVEARMRNLEKCLLLQEHFGLPGLEFVQGDVKDVRRDTHGEFDVVLALGILYHLDHPVEWFRQISAATRGVIVVDSHVAPVDDAALSQLDSRLAPLGPLERMEVGGWMAEGRWKVEYTEGMDVETELWSSYSNPRSFWLTKESLLLGMLRAGFDLVFEQHDYSVEHFHRLTAVFPRGLFIGIKLAGVMHPDAGQAPGFAGP